ncbi:MAG: hypothetical protein AB1468_03770 [Candidatus Micrarchaeota archaeon]
MSVEKTRTRVRTHGGQLFTIDFILGLSVFIFILLALLALQTQLESQVESGKARTEMQLIALRISDVLVRTKGTPADWNASNVIRIGLCDEPRAINVTRFLRLKQLSNETARAILGAGPYSLHLSITDANGSTLTSGVARSPVAYYSVDRQELVPILNNSGLAWDFYLGRESGSLPATGDARFFYRGPRAELFDNLTLNQTNYNTIIMEEPGLADSEVNITRLKNFLDEGGILIYEGDGKLLENFSMVWQNASAGRNGTVNSTGYFFSASAGANITFSSATGAFYANTSLTGAVSNLRVYVSDSSNSSLCLACMWHYSNGLVYYASDINGTFDATGSNFSSALSIAGPRLDYGSDPSGLSSAGDILAIRRACVLVGDKNQPVNLNVLLWR